VNLPPVRVSRWCWLAASLVLSLGCERTEPTPARRVASVPATTRTSLLTHAGLEDALGRLRGRLGRDVQALELRVRADRLVLQARDQTRHQQVLEHVVENGNLLPPVEVELRGPGQLEDNLFPLADARLEQIPEMCARAVERVDPRAGRVSLVLLRRNLPLSSEIQFRVYVSSPVRDGYLDADLGGRPLDDERGSGRESGSARR
jgi:hypothetical protein